MLDALLVRARTLLADVVVAIRYIVGTGAARTCMIGEGDGALFRYVSSVCGGGMSRDTLGCGLTLVGALLFAGLAWVTWSSPWGILLAALAVTVAMFGVGGFSQNWNVVEMFVIAVILALLWVLLGAGVWWKLHELESMEADLPAVEGGR